MDVAISGHTAPCCTIPADDSHVAKCNAGRHHCTGKGSFEAAKTGYDKHQPECRTIGTSDAMVTKCNAGDVWSEWTRTVFLTLKRLDGDSDAFSSSTCDWYVIPQWLCAMQKEVVEIEKVHAEVLEERDSTIHDMEKKVKTSQQFLEQKDSMDSALQQLQHTLEIERKKHQQDIGCDSHQTMPV